MNSNVKIGNLRFPPLLFAGMRGAPNGGWGVGKPGFPIPLPGGRVWATHVHLVVVRRNRMDD